MVHDISHDKGTDAEPKAPAASDQLARDQAVKQIERRRHFWMRATMGTLFMLILAVIWAFAEYHNAGGWPTNGFSRARASRTCGTTGSSTRPSRGCC